MRSLAPILIVVIAASVGWTLTDLVLRNVFDLLLGPWLTLALFAGWVIALWLALRNRLS